MSNTKSVHTIHETGYGTHTFTGTDKEAAEHVAGCNENNAIQASHEGTSPSVASEVKSEK